MKFMHNKRYRKIALHACIVALFAVLCVFVGLYLPSISSEIVSFVKAIKSLIYAFVFAFMLRPLERICCNLFAFVERKKPHPKLRRGLGVVLVYIIVLSFVALSAMIFIPQVIDSAKDFYSQRDAYLEQGKNLINSLSATNSLFGDLYGYFSDLLSELINDLINTIKVISSAAISSAGTLINETKNVLLGFLFSVYFLLNYNELKRVVSRFFRAVLPTRVYDYLKHVAAVSGSTFGCVYSGMTLDAILICICSVILLTLFKIRYAPMIGLIIGIASFIPYIGIFIGSVPGLVIVLLSSTDKLIWYIIIVLALQLVDGNIIEPRLLRDVKDLKAMRVLISVIVMGGLFGVTGLLIGMPLFNVIYVLIKEAAEKRLAGAGLPEDTDSYLQPGVPDIKSDIKETAPDDSGAV
ncbi:MAG: AI-2E family transporter [Clostridiales bacterium]|nr:AI-2E family transporter [Clostridiales bacterium]